MSHIFPGTDGLPTRTTETEETYSRRAQSLLKKCAKELSEKSAKEMNVDHVAISPDDIEPMQLASWLIGHRPKIAKSSWRQYKSAIIYWLRNVKATHSALQAALYLEDKNSSVCLKKTMRTSGRRLKSYNEKTFHELLSAIDRLAPVSPHKRYAGILKTWLMLGVMTGLRPHEWCQASMITIQANQKLEGQAVNLPPSDPAYFQSNQYDVSLQPPHTPGDRTSPSSARLNQQDVLVDGTHAALLPGHTYLRVKNSKHTNGRAHGEYRHLDITRFNAVIRKSIDAFSKYMNSLSRARYKYVYDGCRLLLAEINNAHFGDGVRHIQLYSARHFYASNAKKLMQPAQVAAAMGHANDETAYSLYGNARYGSGGLIAIPVESEARRIRRVKKTPAFLQPDAPAPASEEAGL